MKQSKIWFVVTVAVFNSLFLPLQAKSGSLDAPAAPTNSGSAMYSINDLYNRLNSGTNGSKRTAGFTEPTSGPDSTNHTLNEVMNLMPAADNTNGALTADVAAGKTFWGLRTDGTWGLQTGTKNSSSSNMNNTVTSATGRVWMDRNLGASQVATSSTDEAAYGDLYQWGRGSDGHEIRTSGTTSATSSSDNPGHGNFITNPTHPSDWRVPQNDTLWQGVSGTNNVCPAGFRLPTDIELDNERLSWGSQQNSAGAFASPLKLVAAGYRFRSDGTIGNVGSIGLYWSSTVDRSIASRRLGLYSDSAYMSGSNRAFGFSARCIED